MSGPDPYAVLGVSKNAKPAEIRTAYRKLVLKCHPDKIKDETERAQRQDEFQRVQDAYELLTDETRRAMHDHMVKSAEARKTTSPSFSSPPAAAKRAPPKWGGYFKASTFNYRDGKLYEQETYVRRQPDDDELRSTEESQPARKGYDWYDKRPTAKDGDDKKKRKSNGKKSESKPNPSSQPTKEKLRDELRSSRSARAKYRDKERRRDQSEKQSRTAYVGSEDESEPDDRAYTTPRSPNPRATPEKNDPPQRESPKYMLFEDSAFEYIQRSKASAPPEQERRPSTSYHRRQSSPQVYYEPPTTEPLSGETARRSSARRSHPKRDEPSRTGSERREPVEVVDSPLRGRQASRRTPPTGSSGSVRVATGTPRGGPTRSSTFQVRDSKEVPSLRRAETTPLASVGPRRSEPRPMSKPASKPRDRYDSGYSSPGTPEMHGSPPKSSKFTIVDENEDYSSPPPPPPPASSSPRGHRTVLVEPYKRHQSVSPNRRRVTPITVRPASRPAQPRSRNIPTPRNETTTTTTTTRVIPPSRDSPPPLRHSSGRDGLFGEVSGSDDHIQRFSSEQIRYSPKIRQEDIRFSHNKPYRPGVIRRESYSY